MIKRLLFLFTVFFLFYACTKEKAPEHPPVFGECGTVVFSNPNVGNGLKTTTEIEKMVDERMNYFISQFGSEENFEKFYGKSVAEIRQEYIQVFTDSLSRE